ncbi:MAG: FtsW/RodA/SpoVE family cell cycle protein [Oscillospiraceae bacterium]|nr:FtsW/RodA/SpoVE family cell cycle protein [Oscillospiraceae bacterium]
MFAKLTKSVTFPALMLVLANILAFGLLFMFGMSQLEAIYIIFGTLALFIIMYSLILYFKLGDKYIMLISAMLVTFGIIMLTRIDPHFASLQIGWVAISIGGFFGAYFIYKAVKIWKNIWWVYIAATIVLFIITMIFGIEINGARRWIRIGNFTMQPLELMRIMLVMFLACYYSGHFKSNLSRIPGIGKFLNKIPAKYYAMLGVYVFIGSLIMQREWGTSLLLFGIYMLMIFVFEPDWKLLALNAGIAVAGAMLGYMNLFHIQTRFAAWVDPWADVARGGFQITQSLFAISAGGYFGTGIGNGAPTHIPEVHSDFIFAAICEELGIFGGVAVILLFFLLCYRCFKIAIQTKDTFNKAVAFGIAAGYGLQTFIIIGGVINFIPLTGITLPFVSYGGSSMVVSFAALGIVQAISSGNSRERRVAP